MPAMYILYLTICLGASPCSTLPYTEALTSIDCRHEVVEWLQLPDIRRAECRLIGSNHNATRQVSVQGQATGRN